MLVMVNDDRKSYYTFVVIMVVAVSITLFFNQKQKVHNAIPLCGKITAYVSFDIRTSLKAPSSAQTSD